MAWSYSGNPEANDKDAVRFEIQDTEANAPLLQDEEITYAIVREAGEEPDEQGLLSAAARCCEIVARKFTRQADIVVGSEGITYSKMAANYRAMAKELRVRAQGYGTPFAGGQTKSEKRALRADPNRVQPEFRRGQHKIRRNQGASTFPGEEGIY